jgi:hypothetical protein
MYSQYAASAPFASELLDLDQLEALGREIDHDVVLVGPHSIARLNEDRSLPAPLSAEDDMRGLPRAGSVFIWRISAY